jgi:hypothetical protein
MTIDSVRDFCRRAHVRVGNGLSVRILHNENGAAFAFYRVANCLGGISVAEIPAKLRLGMCRPVRLRK